MAQENAITINKKDARRFLLAHHFLWPPRKLAGKQGVLEYIRRVNCIQYDPINVVGQNPHLLLQSRIKAYKPEYLSELLYEDRSLLDGLDKVMSIYPVEDWPNFAHHRKHNKKRAYSAENTIETINLRKTVLKEIRDRGPLSPLDIDIDFPVDWAWGPTKAGRAGLEMLFFDGEILVDHRVGTRRYFDLAKRLLPKSIYSRNNPHPNKKAHQEWHVARRIGGLGLARPGAGEHWGGLLGMKSGERKQILEELRNRNEIIAVTIEGMEKLELYIRSQDKALLEKVRKGRSPKLQASILAPLDNFMWDRKLLSQIFDFDYVWEVYKPEKKRKYGYYVLPIMLGDQFIARFDPYFDRSTGQFAIKNWWWEKDVPIEKIATREALQNCFKEFMSYLNAKTFELTPLAMKIPNLQSIFD